MSVATKKNSPKPRKSGSVLDEGLSPGVMEEMKQNGRKLVGEKQPKPKSKTQGKAMGIICKVYQKGEGTKPLTVEEAMDLIGWEVVEEGQFTCRDIHGNKIRLKNNSTNRPFRPGLVKRYMLEVLRGKWKLNGETIIFDWDGKCQSGQHRLVAFILAEEARREDAKLQKGKWSKYHKSPITLECLVVHGVDPSPEVVDTIDQGQKRTIGDVFFRQDMFGGGTKPASYSLGEGKGKETINLPVMGAKMRQRLCNIAAGAARLTWLRSGGKNVSDAPQFPVSEAVDFLQSHVGLLYSVAFINGLEGGDSKEGQKVSRFTTLGYASSLFYLMATSSTDQEEYQKVGPAALDFKNMKKAKEFWGRLASGANLHADDPVYVLRELLPKVDKGSAIGRDECVAMIAKAFAAFMDGKKAKARDLSVAKRVNDVGREQLVDDPHIGGLDVEGIEKPEIEPGEDVYDPANDDREGSRSKKGKWQEGDTCWVKHTEEDGGSYFGTVREVIEADAKVGGAIAMVEADDGQTWEEQVSRLSVKYPG